MDNVSHTTHKQYFIAISEQDWLRVASDMCGTLVDSEEDFLR